MAEVSKPLAPDVENISGNYSLYSSMNSMMHEYSHKGSKWRTDNVVPTCINSQWRPCQTNDSTGGTFII